MIGAMYLAMTVCTVHANTKAGTICISITEIKEAADMRATTALAFSRVTLLT